MSPSGVFVTFADGVRGSADVGAVALDAGAELSAESQLDAILTRPANAGLASPVRGTGARRGAGAGGGASPRGDTQPALALGFASPYSTGAVINVADADSAGAPHLQSPLSLSQGATATMATVLRAQRERLHVRVLELESEAQARAAELSEAHARAQKLTSDNVKMYEKIRFLQSFLQTAAGEVQIDMAAERAAAGGAMLATTVNRAELRARATGAAAVSVFGEEDFERSYRKLYQDSLDPFESFARQQRQQRFQSLSPADRIALRGGRLMLGSKVARSFALAYALALHALVAATLWHFTTARHSDGCASAVAGGAPLGLAVRN
jgi:homeobox protein cut-like